MLTAKNSQQQLNFLQRQYYPSPSINTLLKIEQRYNNKKCKMNACIKWGSRAPKNIFNCEGCHYFKAYTSILQGNDFKPVIEYLNSIGYKDFKKINLKYYEIDKYNIDTYKKMILKLPKITESLFKSSHEAVLEPGTPFIYKHKIARDTSGKAEVHYKSTSYSANTTTNFIELTKNLADIKIQVSDGEPTVQRSGFCSICGIANFKHSFLSRPELLILTNRKIISGKIIAARVAITYAPCKENESYLQIAVNRPIKDNIFCLLFIHPNLKSKITYKILKYKNNFWMIDLNNDNIADIVGIIER